LKYTAFSESPPAPILKLISPCPDDPPDYVAIAAANDKPGLCLTTTCAANLLGLVPPEDSAFGDSPAIESGFELLSSYLNKPAKDCAEEFLACAAAKCQPLINELIQAEKLDRTSLTLFGGGGGAAAIVPYLAKQMGLKFLLADSADVISAIGVALALVRETVERHVLNPSNDDILKIRQEAEAAIARAGAAPTSVQVFIEIDPQTSTIRATATGATSLTEVVKNNNSLSKTEKLDIVASSINLPIEKIELAAATDYFQVFSAIKTKSSLFGLINTKTKALRVMDVGGVIRFQASNGEVVLTNQKEADKAISELSTRLSIWGDAGRTIPNLILLAGTKIFDLSGLMVIEQVLSLAKAELDTLPSDSPVIVVATQH
jgi:N-methylhydantoinase A